MTAETFKKIAITLSMVLMLNVFFNYGISAFYPEPKYDDYCGKYNGKDYQTKEKCLEEGGFWQEAQNPANEGKARPVQGFCNIYEKCGKEFESRRNAYNKNVFIILSILGLLSLGLGLAIKVSVISLGFMYGGFISFFIGTVRFWSVMDDYLRFAISGFTLAIIVWLGYKKLK